MSLREDAERVLKEWTAPEERYERLRRDFLDHVVSHSDAMWKSLRAGHITGSALVVDWPGGGARGAPGRVLLTLHAKIGKWLQLGGHCEPGDVTLAGVALREAMEESGIAGLGLAPGGPIFLDRHVTPCAWHLDVSYLVLAPPGAMESISDESLDLRWFSFDEAAEVADESVRRLLGRARTVLEECG